MFGLIAGKIVNFARTTVFSTFMIINTVFLPILLYTNIFGVKPGRHILYYFYFLSSSCHLFSYLLDSYSRSYFYFIYCLSIFFYNYCFYSILLILSSYSFLSSFASLLYCCSCSYLTFFIIASFW